MKAPKFLQSRNKRLLFFSSILVGCVIATIYFSVASEANASTSLILLVVPVIISVILNLSNEIIGADFHNLLEGKKKENEVGDQNIEPAVNKFFDSLKEGFPIEPSFWQRVFISKIEPPQKPIGQYQKRYNSKLDGRFEITLEVSDDFDSPDKRSITEQFGQNATIGIAIETIRQAFKEKGSLLIAGNKGTGKTVLLLKLAIDLLDQVSDPETQPFPVIFNLASWSDDYKSFGDWLRGSLVSGYGLSNDFAQELLRQNRIILLLDGLDELARNEEDKDVAAKIRAACLDSLNEYLALHSGCQTVICSRIDEFVAMKKRQKQDAPVSKKLRVLNLSPEKVINALKNAAADPNFKHHTSANNLLNLTKNGANASLLELLRTPFYFTTALEVFTKPLSTESNLPTDTGELEELLLERFITKKLNPEVTENPHNFDAEKTRKWLRWMAKLMEKKGLVVFELADLQPTDLVKRWHFNLIYGVFAGFIVFFFSSIHFVLIFGPDLGLVSAMSFGLILGWASPKFVFRISTEDKVDLNISRLLTSDHWFLFLFPFLFGWGLSLAMGMLYGWIAGISIGSFYTLYFVFVRIKEIKAIALLSNPHQRITGGFSLNFFFPLIVQMFVFTILIVSTFCESCQLIRPAKILFAGSSLIVLISLLQSSLCLHIALRIASSVEKSLPLKYATFLDYAADAKILEKDGGHWRFRHQNLQDYFAKKGLD